MDGESFCFFPGAHGRVTLSCVYVTPRFSCCACQTLYKGRIRTHISLTMTLLWIKIERGRNNTGGKRASPILTTAHYGVQAFRMLNDGRSYCFTSPCLSYRVNSIHLVYQLKNAIHGPYIISLMNLVHLPRIIDNVFFVNKHDNKKITLGDQTR